MSILTSPNEILRRDTAQAQRLVQGVGQQRTMGLLQKAQSDLNARLRRAEGLGGPGRDSFTAAHLRTTLAQVRAVTAHLQVGMKGVVTSQAKSAAEWASNSAVSYLNRAERHFTGSTERLNLDGARLVDRAVANTNSSVLNRLLNGPDPRKKAGILQRYGENVVENFEARLQQRLIQRKPLAEVRDELIADSPFLQAAPGHWAERIVRTETMHAENTAILETIHQADDELGDMCKIISSVFDARTGADSFAVHGQIRRPKEAFDSWFGSYQNPPDRPNDRSIAVPHRISWPIPDALKPKSDGAVSARWSAEGRKGSPPSRPKMTTIPLEQFGRPAAAPENPGSQGTRGRSMGQVPTLQSTAPLRPPPPNPLAAAPPPARRGYRRARPVDPTTLSTAAELKEHGIEFNEERLAEFHQASQEVFGEPITPALIKRMVGMEDLGGKTKYNIGIYGNKLLFGGTVKHEDGEYSYLNRDYVKNQDGTIDVHHAIFKIAETQRAKGFGKQVLRNQVAEYEKLPVRAIRTEAAWDGQYVWPNMGFTLRDPSALAPLQKEFRHYLVTEMLVPEADADRAAHASTSVQELAHTQVEGRKVGKQFLLERGNSDGQLIDLHVRPGTPEWASFRAYLSSSSSPAR